MSVVTFKFQRLNVLCLMTSHRAVRVIAAIYTLLLFSRPCLLLD